MKLRGNEFWRMRGDVAAVVADRRVRPPQHWTVPLFPIIWECPPGWRRLRMIRSASADLARLPLTAGSAWEQRRGPVASAPAVTALRRGAERAVAAVLAAERPEVVEEVAGAVAVVAATRPELHSEAHSADNTTRSATGARIPISQPEPSPGRAQIPCLMRRLLI